MITFLESIRRICLARSNFLQRTLTMSVLCLAGGTIYMLPFLREAYYDQIIAAFGFSNSELALLSSVFGIVALLCYFPGGWLADRYSARRLMSFSLLTTALGGFWLATYPGFEISLVIHAFWGATTSLTFWAALVKATRAWGSASEQGKAFGFLELGRGLVEAATASIFWGIFLWLGSQPEQLWIVILLFALVNLGLALVVWRVFTDDAGTDYSPEERLRASDVIRVLKMPAIWLISLVVLAAYSAYWGLYNFAPYANAYTLSLTIGGTLTTAKNWLKPLVALVIGFFSDRLGVAEIIFGLFVVMSLCFAVFGVLPGDNQYLWLLMVCLVLVSICIFALRCLYFALLQETGISPAMTATATGVISAIGFTPDIFMPWIGGQLLDAYPGVEGFRYYFLTIALISLVGTLAAAVILVKKRWSLYVQTQV